MDLVCPAGSPQLLRGGPGVTQPVSGPGVSFWGRSGEDRAGKRRISHVRNMDSLREGVRERELQSLALASVVACDTLALPEVLSLVAQAE